MKENNIAYFVKLEDSDETRQRIIREIDNGHFSNSLALQVLLNKFKLTPYLYENDDIDPIFENYKKNAKSSTNSFVLHPDQYEVLEYLESKKNIIVSAPTSFGKTAAIFEYIARNNKNIDKIVIIIPTIALRNEYLEKINDCLNEHVILTNCNDMNKYEKYCMIITHERFVEYFYKIENQNFDIDLLVIDEIYKLQNENDDKRMYTMSLAYLTALKKAKQYIFLGPFINKINIPDLEEYCTLKYSYSPIATNMKYDANQKITSTTLLRDIKSNEKTLVYFSSKNELLEMANEISDNNNLEVKNADLVQYIENEYGREWVEEWPVIKALKKGIGIHYNEVPSFIKEYVIDSYNNTDDTMILFATSTLLEGVNTATKRLIITSKNNGPNNLSDFEFWNLVGRAGRLGKYKVGEVIYYGNENDFIEEKKYIDLDNLWINLNSNKDEYEIIRIGNLSNAEKQQKISEIIEEYNISLEEIKYVLLPYMSKIDEVINFFETIYPFLISEIKRIINETEYPSKKLRKLLFDSFIKKYKPTRPYGELPTGVFEILSNGVNISNNTRRDKIIYIVSQARNWLKETKLDKDNPESYKLKMGNLYNYSFYMVNNYIENSYVPGIMLLKSLFERNNSLTSEEMGQLQKDIFKQAEQYANMVSNDDIYETLGVISPLAEIIKEVCGKVSNLSELKKTIKEKRQSISKKIENNKLYKHYFNLLISKLKIN